MAAISSSLTLLRQPHHSDSDVVVSAALFGECDKRSAGCGWCSLGGEVHNLGIIYQFIKTIRTKQKDITRAYWKGLLPTSHRDFRPCAEGAQQYIAVSVVARGFAAKHPAPHQIHDCRVIFGH